MDSSSFDDWRDILAFHVEAGVDVAVGETPVDRFAESAAAQAAAAARAQGAPNRVASGTSAPARPASPAPAGSVQSRPAQGEPAHAASAPVPARAGSGASSHLPPVPTLSAAPPDMAEMAARDMAHAAATLDDLRAIMEVFDGCPLKRTATRMVFADGNPQARIMFVGEAPGRDEDEQGLPFVGRSGRLLDLMLGAIGLDRTSAYIANVIPWRPPGNRTPTPQETAICLPFIRRQIQLVDPDILVCLGGPSAQALLAVSEGITKMRGRLVDYDTGTRVIRALPTFHPAYLLRTPLGKRLVWRDLLAVEALLAKDSAKTG
ncbi:uracil-DNA glycosylase family protein [Xanthobacter sp. VNH20]|uniref:uracil-DNA glycosylase n=1 Tax=Xanthobacter sp. VNH20 TaxID=3156616 RepID=UPI0032B40185